MILASLEIFHSRPIAPTRRLALGQARLPTDPAPGPGSILVGGIVARHLDELDGELVDDVSLLLTQLELGVRIVQPRVRHRLQRDRVGLLRTEHRLVREASAVIFDFGASQGSAAVQILGAVYAAGRLGPAGRRAAIGAVRKALAWRGPVGPQLVAHLAGRTGVQSWATAAYEDPVEWALEVLGFERIGRRKPTRSEIQRRFRRALREAHPDSGGEVADAADRIAAITEAKRILLGG
ncbi:MAG: hypothetical protein ACKVWR_10690 [Acidimicrobiales bacterium]